MFVKVTPRTKNGKTYYFAELVEAIDDNAKIIKSCPEGLQPKHTVDKGNQMIAHFTLETCRVVIF